MTLAYRTTLHRIDRRDDRHAVDRASTLRAEDGQPVDVILDDISFSGFRISQAPHLDVGEGVAVGLAGVGTRSADVIWCSGGLAGCQFHQPLSREELEITQHIRATVTTFPGVSEDAAPSAEPSFRRLRFRTRLAVIAATVVGSWLLLGALVATLWTLFRS